MKIAFERVSDQQVNLKQALERLQQTLDKSQETTAYTPQQNEVALQSLISNVIANERVKITMSTKSKAKKASPQKQTALPFASSRGVGKSVTVKKGSMAAKELERRIRQSEQDKAKSQAGAFCKYEHTFLVEIPEGKNMHVAVPEGLAAFLDPMDTPAEPWETECVETRSMTFRVTSGPGTFAALSICVGYPADTADLSGANCAAFKECALTEGNQSISLKVPVVAKAKFNVCLSFRNLKDSSATQFFVEGHMQCRIIMK